MRTESQNKVLRKHLLSGKSIAPLQALNNFGIFRLASRIKDLRDDGLNIETKMIHEHPVKYAKYKLVKK
jgi:hypothetical protein